MAQKTAMQELIEHLDFIIKVLPKESTGSIMQTNNIINKALSLLEKEKEQIQIAFEQGMIKESSSSRYISDLEAEKYYNETFKN